MEPRREARPTFAPTILRGVAQRDSKISAMSEDHADLILEHLRAICGDIAEIKADLVEIKQRLGRLEAQYANVFGRVDRIAGDIALIKRRLDLVEA